MFSRSRFAGLRLFRQHAVTPHVSQAAHSLRRRRRLFVSLLALLTTFVLLSALLATLVGVEGVLRPSTAHAIARDGLPPHGEGTPPLSFQSGFVQYHPKVYFVFWGQKWNNDSTHVSVKAKLEALFRSLAGSSYNNILTQYSNQSSDPNGHIHNDVQFMGSLVDPTPPMANVDLITDVSTEAQWGFRQFGLSADKNIQVLVFPQQGTTFFTLFGQINYCGAHYYMDTNTLAYGEVRFASDVNGCKWSGVYQDGTSVDVETDIIQTAVHEYAEIATDPHIFPSTSGAAGSGWNTGNPVIPDIPPTPKEVADLCQDYSPASGSTIPGNPSPYPITLGYHLPYLWGNYSGAIDNNKGCLQHAGQDFTSPDTTLPYHGLHTVQGGILDKYRETGITTLLGAPLTEETSLPGGAVSYFAGQVCGGGYVIPSSSQDGGIGLTSGSAIYNSLAGTFEVHGCIFQKYAAMGGPGEALGFPISDEYATPAGRESDFQHGSITSDAAGIQVHIGDGKPSVALNKNDGRLEAFKWGGDGALWHNTQLSRGSSSWSGWSSLGGVLAGDPTVKHNYDGRLEVFVRGIDGKLWHRSQIARGGPGWSDWALLDGVILGTPAVGLNILDGKLEVFVRGIDGALWHRSQSASGSSVWSPWALLDGHLSSDPTVAANQDGRLEVFVLGIDGAIWHMWQTAPGSSSWSGWNLL